MENLIPAVVLLIIIGLAAGYIVRAKKKGHKCIGCPYAASCSGKGKGGCGGEGNG